MARIPLPDGITILHGLEATRASVIPDTGELLVTDDQGRVYHGDGATAGANEIAYRRLNYVDEVPVQTAVVATPAAGKVTELYSRDGYQRWVDDAGTEHTIYPVTEREMPTPLSKQVLADCVGNMFMVRKLVRVPFTTLDGRQKLNSAGTISATLDVSTLTDNQHEFYLAWDLTIGYQVFTRPRGDLLALPGGYEYFSYIGTYVKSSGSIPDFVQNNKVVQFAGAAPAPLTNGVSTVFSTVALAAWVPDTNNIESIDLSLSIVATSVVPGDARASLRALTSTGLLMPAKNTVVPAGAFNANDRFTTSVTVGMHDTKGIEYQVNAAVYPVDLTLSGWRFS